MTAVRKTLENVIRAWEATTPGSTQKSEIQRWLIDDMKPAIDQARETLASPVVDIAEAWSLVSAERQRQIDEEGWSPQHDDVHDDGAMLRAAVIYLHHETETAPALTEEGTPLGWPWEKQWWKPKDRTTNLIRAGALCLAERERCLRAGLPTGPADHKLGLCLAALCTA